MWIRGPRRSGKYEGNFYLDASDKANSSSAPVTILASDHWLAPAIVLAVGIVFSAWLSRYWGPGATRRKEARTRQELALTKDKLERAVLLYEKKLKIEYPKDTFALYRIHASLKSRLDSVRLENLEQDKETLNDLYSYFGQFQHFMRHLKQLAGSLKAFLAAHQDDDLYPPEPDIVYEVEVLTLAGEEEVQPIESMAQLAGLASRLSSLELLFARFKALYEMLKKHEADLKTAKLLKVVKRRLWTADTERAMEYAQDTLIRALLRAGVKSLQFQAADLELSQRADRGRTSEDVCQIKDITIDVKPESPTEEEKKLIKNGKPVPITVGRAVLITATVELEGGQVPCTLDMTWKFGDGGSETLTGVLVTAGGSKKVTLPYRYLAPGVLYIEVSVESKPTPFAKKQKLEILPEVGSWEFLRSLPRRARKWVRHLLLNVRQRSWLVRQLFTLGRWAVVGLSAYSIVYLTNPTFGSARDYIVAFLWGSTADTALKAINSILGLEKGILTAFPGLFK